MLQSGSMINGPGGPTKWATGRRLSRFYSRGLLIPLFPCECGARGADQFVADKGWSAFPGLCVTSTADFQDCRRVAEAPRNAHILGHETPNISQQSTEQPHPAEQTSINTPSAQAQSGSQPRRARAAARAHGGG